MARRYLYHRKRDDVNTLSPTEMSKRAHDAILSTPSEITAGFHTTLKEITERHPQNIVVVQVVTKRGDEYNEDEYSLAPDNLYIFALFTDSNILELDPRKGNFEMPLGKKDETYNENDAWSAKWTQNEDWQRYARARVTQLMHEHGWVRSGTHERMVHALIYYSDEIHEEGDDESPLVFVQRHMYVPR